MSNSISKLASHLWGIFFEVMFCGILCGFNICLSSFEYPQIVFINEMHNSYSYIYILYSYEYFIKNFYFISNININLYIQNFNVSLLISPVGYDEIHIKILLNLLFISKIILIVKYFAIYNCFLSVSILCLIAIGMTMFA